MLSVQNSLLFLKNNFLFKTWHKKNHWFIKCTPNLLNIFLIKRKITSCSILCGEPFYISIIHATFFKCMLHICKKNTIYLFLYVHEMSVNLQKETYSWKPMYCIDWKNMEIMSCTVHVYISFHWSKNVC